MSKLTTLKKLITCLGCSECTEDVTATTNAEALEYLCEHADDLTSKFVRDIKITVDADGHLVSGWWGDWAGHRHTIEIRRQN